MQSVSLCSGYGGLDLAVEEVFGTGPTFVADVDPSACKVLGERFPAVPNLGDIKAVDWASVGDVDLLTAGYPCQPFSHAGKRQGEADDRHLWPAVFGAVRVLRPRLVVLENVAGHLGLGFDTVLADLASIGFDAEWCVVRASDVGACHQRARLFVVAADSGGERHGRRQVPRMVGRLDDEDARETRERERAWAQFGDGGDGPAPHSDHGDDSGLHAGRGETSGAVLRRAHTGTSGQRTAAAGEDVAHSAYEPAIRRHEFVLGRPAPDPLDDRGRLSPRFVEWMMMLPEGWVTDLDLSRSAQLRLLGNGVVPPQAGLALRRLVERL